MLKPLVVAAQREARDKERRESKRDNVKREYDQYKRTKSTGWMRVLLTMVGECSGRDLVFWRRAVCVIGGK